MQGIKSTSLTVVIGTLQKGGAERVVSVLSKEFLEPFSQVEIIMWQEGAICYEIDSRVCIVCVERETKSKQLFKQMSWFRNYVKEKQPNTILSFLAPFNLVVLTSLLFTSIPVFVADRSNPKYDLKNRMLQIVRIVLYRLSAKQIIVQTESNKKLYHKWLQSKIHVIPNPIYLAENLLGTALGTLKQQKIVTVGRLQFAKNHELLIKAFAHIVARYPNYKLVIYGEGELRGELVRLINDLSLIQSVELPGNVDQIHDYISDAKIFVFPSRWEGMPNALIEAMALGLPVISSNIPAVSGFVTHKENGLLFTSESKEELVDCMNYLLENPSKGKQMAQRATFIAKKLSLNEIVKLWMNIM